MRGAEIKRVFRINDHSKRQKACVEMAWLVRNFSGQRSASVRFGGSLWAGSAPHFWEARILRVDHSTTERMASLWTVSQRQNVFEHRLRLFGSQKIMVYMALRLAATCIFCFTLSSVFVLVLGMFQTMWTAICVKAISFASHQSWESHHSVFIDILRMLWLYLIQRPILTVQL